MPHLPHVDIHVPEIHVPPIEIPGIPIGHKTNKWEIRHNLEKDGWWVAYGKEVGYQEYYEFYQAVGASVASDNPGPAMAYLEYTIQEGVTVLLRNAGREFGDRLRSVAQRELVRVMNDAIRHGRVETIRLRDLQLQLGMATYNRSESGVPLPNTFQPYIRMRLILDHDDGQPRPNSPQYLWVTTLYNPNNVELHYSVRYGQGAWEAFAVAPNGWRWHSHSSSNDPHLRISFDSGPAGGNLRREYALNSHRLIVGTQPSDDKGEPYNFGGDNSGWNLFSGRPRRLFQFQLGTLEHRGNGQWVMNARGQTHTFQERVRNNTYIELECTSRDHNHVRVQDSFLEVLQALSDAQPQTLVWKTYPDLRGNWR